MDPFKEKYGENLKGLGGEAFKRDNIESAGAIKEGEVKTQSCTINNMEGNPNHGYNGQIKEEKRQDFIDGVLRCTKNTREPSGVMTGYPGFDAVMDGDHVAYVTE